MCGARVLLHLSLPILAIPVLVLVEAGLERALLSASPLFSRLENHASLGFFLSFRLLFSPYLSPPPFPFALCYR